MDPASLLGVVNGVWVGLLACAASLQSRVLACVSQGADLGRMAAKIVLPYILRLSIVQDKIKEANEMDGKQREREGKEPIKKVKNHKAILGGFL